MVSNISPTLKSKCKGSETIWIITAKKINIGDSIGVTATAVGSLLHEMFAWMLPVHCDQNDSFEINMNS